MLAENPVFMYIYAVQSQYFGMEYNVARSTARSMHKITQWYVYFSESSIQGENNDIW